MKNILVLVVSIMLLQQPARQEGELEGVVFRIDTNEPLAILPFSKEAADCADYTDLIKGRTPSWHRFSSLYFLRH